MTKAKADFIFLGLLCLLIQLLIFTGVYSGYPFSLNNYLAVIAWAVAITLRLINHKYGRAATAWLLVLGTFNIVNFSIWRSAVSFGINLSSLEIETPGLSIELLLILIAYYFVNKKRIKEKIGVFFNGSTGEKQAKYDKMVAFYLDKFGSLSTEELDGIYSNINAYPEEAQQALIELKGRGVKQV